MATITITNLSAAPIYLRDFYTTIGAAGSTNTALGPAATITLTSNTAGNTNLTGGNTKMARAAAQVENYLQLMDLVAAGTITVTVTPSANEIASGLGGGVNSVSYNDVSEVAAAAAPGVPFVLRIPLASTGTSGTIIDTTVFAAGSLPFKIRVLDATAYVTTNTVASNWVIGDQAAGAGNTLATLSANAVATVRNGAVSAVSAAPAATIGLFVRRDRATVGELIVWCRRET